MRLGPAGKAYFVRMCEDGEHDSASPVSSDADLSEPTTQSDPELQSEVQFESGRDRSVSDSEVYEDITTPIGNDAKKRRNRCANWTFRCKKYSRHESENEIDLQLPKNLKAKKTPEKKSHSEDYATATSMVRPAVARTQ